VVSLTLSRPAAGSGTRNRPEEFVSICARLLVVVFTRLEDGDTRSMDRLERGATSAQSADDRKSNQSRFLLLPWVRVKGLASKILAQIARQLPADWECRDGYRPLLLETLVDAQRFRGTCYRAANWIHVGQTQGRGRMDREHRAAGLAIKDIYLYPLRRDVQRELCRNTPRGRS
jgi:hypothetical protein